MYTESFELTGSWRTYGATPFDPRWWGGLEGYGLKFTVIVKVFEIRIGRYRTNLEARTDFRLWNHFREEPVILGREEDKDLLMITLMGESTELYMYSTHPIPILNAPNLIPPNETSVLGLSVRNGGTDGVPLNVTIASAWIQVVERAQ
jgi:hypothetical protein